MGIKEYIQNRMPSTRRFVERRLSEQDARLEEIYSNQRQLVDLINVLTETQKSLAKNQTDLSKKISDMQKSVDNRLDLQDEKQISLNKELADKLDKQAESDKAACESQEKYWMDNSKAISVIDSTLADVTEDNNKIVGLLKPLNELGSIKRAVNSLNEGMLKSIDKPVLQLSYDLTEHCNLNCAGCDHFSPIAEPSFTEIGEFKRDIARLSELFGGIIRHIHLVGGEPLLHPEVCDFMKVARRYFPEGKIKIVTNGVLLKQIGAVFWETASEYKISVEVSPYPIDIHPQEVSEIAQKYGVQVEFFCRGGLEIASEYDPKNMMHMPLILDGDGDASANWLGCYHANNCICVKHGKIYPCTICPCIEHFNKKYHTKLTITKGDYLDIYSEITANDIMHFLSRPIPFCRYCDTRSRKYTGGWEKSSGDISEWT